MELDRQGRSCRREDEKIREPVRFMRHLIRDRPTLAGPEDSPRPRPRPRSRRKEKKKTVREREIGAGNEWREREREEKGSRTSEIEREMKRTT